MGEWRRLGVQRDGAHAEFVVVPAAGVAPKPASLTMTEAAAVGTAFSERGGGAVESGLLRPELAPAIRLPPARRPSRAPLGATEEFARCIECFYGHSPCWAQ
jgi:hypothetical protein